MGHLHQSIVDNIAKECLETFQKLPKTGKPIEDEWTVLSCVIQYESIDDNYKVVALGTGSKCIGASKMSPVGNILNDSHAEIIARRAFLLYLYNNIAQCIQNKDSIFVLKDSLCILKSNIDFVFYSSQLPCGDASIIAKEELCDQVGDIVCHKRLAEGGLCDTDNCKKSKIDDIHRTGAKCLENSEQDPKLPGRSYHLLGQVRTKPGRGDGTLSVSCSDKIARWIHLGIQGGLIDMFLFEPIFIKHFIFGAGVPYSEESLIRALFVRNQDSLEFGKLCFAPHIYQSTILFPYIRSDKIKKPAPCSIICVNNGVFEAAVQGKKIGVTKKKENLPSNYLSICKFNLYKKFQDILNKNNEWRERICGGDDIRDIPYNEMKRRSERYMTKWNEIKKTFFKRWTKKPDIFDFKVTI